jgi:hypothetical protein
LKNFFQRRKILKSVPFEELTPIKIFPSEEEVDGMKYILIPRFKNEILKKVFSSFRSEMIKVKLDLHGSQIWNLIDGKNKIKYIIEEFAKQNSSMKDSKERITLFISQLYVNGFITFKELL